LAEHMHIQPRLFSDRAHEGDGRALAVRSSDMNDRRQFLLRITQRTQRLTQTARADRLPMPKLRAEEGVEALLEEISHRSPLPRFPAECPAKAGLRAGTQSSAHDRLSFVGSRSRRARRGQARCLTGKRCRSASGKAYSAAFARAAGFCFFFFALTSP